MTKHHERTILVTCVTGTIHSVVRRLASYYSDQGHDKRAAPLVSSKIIRWIKIDYNRPETTDNALQNIYSFSSLVEQFAIEYTESKGKTTNNDEIHELKPTTIRF